MISPTKLVVCAVLAFSSSTALADGGCWRAYPYAYAGTIFGPQAYIPAPPYFAMHPPVYYGERYTRPYGMSPFASGPMLQPNPSYTSQRAPQFAPLPKLLSNPYCLTDAEPSGESHEVAKAAPTAGPLVIDNPYFQPQTHYTTRQIQ